MTVSTNIYKPFRARLEKVIEESPLIKTLVLVPETEFSFKTGEFIELTLDGIGEAPFTPSSSPFVKDRIEVTIMKAGYVTGLMHELPVGAVLGVRGPFGRGYPIETFFGKEVLILGGGCGLAPIRSLLYTLIEYKDKLKKVILAYGSKTPRDCIYKPLFSYLNSIDKFEAHRSVDIADENWKETVGVATVMLDKVKVDIPNAVAVVCGPPVMMKFGTFKLLEMGFAPKDIFLSMEKNMSCGLGKCGHCMMGEYFVCKDGPVFTYEEVKNQPHIW
ncbi:MAG: FAD/NAD(P)-binding protein [Bacteroidales bacterium]|nr:FAD/NAD(P)-binding protein [Bacteroidales bacterium]MDZ4203794.1 FAD/NAD(P)-binding protein [Bacteroidales bacterium]